MADAPVRGGQMQVFANEADRNRGLTRNGFPLTQWEQGDLSYVEATKRVEVWTGTEWTNVSTGPNYAVLEAGEPDPQPGDFLPGTLVFRKLP